MRGSVHSEIEIKARVRDPQALFAFLKQHARFKKKFFKKDTYFIREGDEGIGRLIRLRSERGGRTFAAKRRAIENGVEINEERELRMNKKQARSALALLSDVADYRVYAVKEKKGRAYVYQGVLIEVSCIRNLGWFAEFELLDEHVPKEQAMTRLYETLAAVGLSRNDIEPAPYVTLLARPKSAQRQ